MKDVFDGSNIANCECSGLFDGGGILLNSDKIELGPALHDHRKGHVSLSMTWLPDREVPDEYINCCTQGNTDTGTTTSVYLMWHIIIFCLSSLFICAGLYVLYLHRAKNFVSFRSFRLILFQSCNGIIILLLLTVEMVMSYSSSCMYEVIVYWFLVPYHLIYYIFLASKINFLYRWTLAKVDGSLKTLQWYQKNKWFLRDYVFAYMIGAGCIIGAIGMISCMIMDGDPSNGPTALTTMRCSWWNIPQAYTIPRSNSTLCACINAVFGTSEPAACYDAIETVCTNSSMAPEEQTVCSNCYDDYIHSEIHTACSKAMTTFYTDGNCGFPERTPHFHTCRVCMASSRIAISVVSIWICLLATANAALVMYSRGFLDNLNVQVEVLVVVPVVFVLVVNIALIFLDDDYFQFISHAWTGYNLELFCLQLIVVWSTIWTMILTLWKLQFNVVYNKNASFLERMTATIVFAFTPPDDTNEDIIINRNTMHVMAQDISSSSPFQELQFAVADDAARRIYGKFCLSEFSIESFKFLTEFHDALEYVQLRASNDDISEHMFHTILAGMYSSYLADNAPLLLNISSNCRRTAIDAIRLCDQDILTATSVAVDNYRASVIFKPDRESSTSLFSKPSEMILSDDENPLRRRTTLKRNSDHKYVSRSTRSSGKDNEYFIKLYDILNPVRDEVFRLILGDSWSRFQFTAEYYQVRALFESSQELEVELGKVRSDDDN